MPVDSKKAVCTKTPFTLLGSFSTTNINTITQQCNAIRYKYQCKITTTRTILQKTPHAIQQ